VEKIVFGRADTTGASLAKRVDARRGWLLRALPYTGWRSSREAAVASNATVYRWTHRALVIQAQCIHGAKALKDRQDRRLTSRLPPLIIKAFTPEDHKFGRADRRYNRDTGSGRCSPRGHP
jgi:hypothetical protein